MSTRTCSLCKLTKPLTDFHKGKGAYHCKPCKKIYKKNWYRGNVERMRFWHLYKKYKLTKEDYENLLIKQNRHCAICEETKGLSGRLKHLYVDHNHSTGEVRGLLCANCNSTLGFVKEDPKILQNMIEYLNDKNKTSENTW